MLTVHSISALRQTLKDGPRPVLVPTMGNLHEGHIALVEMAKQQHRPIVASIFVNRLQFAPHEDFDTYPRTLAQDAEKLEKAGCDVLFAPLEQELYPQRQTFLVQPSHDLADILEGHFRPGFFTGVCTVVLKLFHCVEPEFAVFGKKDYQQFKIIEQMTAQLCLPVKILSCETMRTSEGLALSSRNSYLTENERQGATLLHQILKKIQQAVQTGCTDWKKLEQEAMNELSFNQWQPDYVSICQQSNLQPVCESSFQLEKSTPLVVLAAARLGKTRLIDNLEL